ncbi:saccharopine dehydrogenase family protein [Chroococcidiopsis thermalis]|uniref:Saccharopine dehydrogenase (NAD(+), L-glutamate-forming) n=1 Tax=Chroococcidiopsis thermalis (strain PCC 7203) TaxID=251229 RepID=K9U231_CHRTP|nr:saccharopine dehydrogenase NADP-binding domain-containing protein [Chroococcidiopsis thermalis]AFY88683.1 Saccharopine dehydrogenase (NAD(+), L-glutamate-forming) [Chroococcidiopsis thermalis PCC 7203]
MTARPYDVVLYGASGFTGKQTVQYFAQHVTPSEVRWAIAGRNRDKLEQVKAQVGVNVDVLVADSQDETAIDNIVSQTRVLLNTAGPFALYGNKIVDACVRFKTHYVDITGETPWVKELCDRYHDRAAADGTRIIPCCGFDSVPSDLGTYLIVRYIQRELGTSCRAVKAYYQAMGGFNGGTLASVFNIYNSTQVSQVSNPFLLNPTSDRSPEEIDRNRDPEFPQYDPDLDTWVAPFFMGAVNTRVVRRSSALYSQWQEPYGVDFTYQEYLKFDPPIGWLLAVGITAATALFIGAIQQPPIRSLLQPLLPQPGSGPSEKTMNEGWFRCELLGLTSDGRKVWGLICDRGDPGNRATVKFLCESALCLALNEDKLPGDRRGGILTPATGLGDVLAERLRHAGMTVDLDRNFCQR